MIYLTKDDYYQVYLKSMISDYDKETLITLYQPLMGGNAAILYLSLYSDYKKNLFPYSHSDMMNNTSLNISQIQDARRKLEGIGLLKTYYKEENNQTYYIYVLYAPKTPHDFFDDILFKGLLIEKIGEKSVQQLARKYKEKKMNLDSYQDITDTFTNVYKPDFSSNTFLSSQTIEGGYQRTTLDLSKGYDIGKFLNILNDKYLISDKYISNQDKEDLSQIGLLYGVEEEVLAALFKDVYRPENENKIDYNKLKELCEKEKFYNVIKERNYASPNLNVNNKISKKIELMETTSPFDFLSIKQRSSKISEPDSKLLNDLSQNYGLNGPVINVLIDYCLENNDNVLSYNYVTKIASGLKRENITSALDAMNYLKKTKNKRKTYQKDNIVVSKNKIENTISDEELDAMLEDL